jgi:alkylation response protein AidB-like acyl-CoA dehydrogenase
MLDYQVARAFTDVRITSIAVGEAEVMKQIIARDTFGPERKAKS